MGGLILPILLLLAVWALTRVTAYLQAAHPMTPSGPPRPPGPHAGAHARPRTGMTHPDATDDARELTAEPIVGWKAAYITSSGDGLRFTGLGVGDRYASEGVATCVFDGDHRPPHPGCGCGFYVLRNRMDALRMMTTSVLQGRPRTPVLLRVELTGRVEEYERGWVGECQTVLGLAVPSSCVGCLGEPTATKLVVDEGYLVAKCDEHADTDALSLADVGGLLGTEAEWTASPLDPRMSLYTGPSSSRRTAPGPGPRLSPPPTDLAGLARAVEDGSPAAIASAKLTILRRDALDQDDWLVVARRLWDALPQHERAHVAKLAPDDHPVWDQLLRG